MRTRLLERDRVTAIVWLRRDLRLHDHPALLAAVDRRGVVIPAFVLDDRLLAGPHASGPRTQFMLECLQDLERSLRQRGSGLVIRRGAPEQVLAQLAGEVPELAAVPDDHLAEPWKMPAEIQDRCGCAIGRDYPRPIVDHAAARHEALERYRT